MNNAAWNWAIVTESGEIFAQGSAATRKLALEACHNVKRKPDVCSYRIVRA